GGALGVLLTVWTLGPFQAALQAYFPIPYWMRFTVDWRGLLFTGIVSLATGAAVGALPAFGATRLDLRTSLQGGRAAGAGGGARAGPWRNAFVVAQVAVTMVLLMAAGLLIRPVGGLEEAVPGVGAAQLRGRTHPPCPRGLPAGGQGVQRDGGRARGAARRHQRDDGAPLLAGGEPGGPAHPVRPRPLAVGRGRGGGYQTGSSRGIR